jgi:hypothetical protein
MMFSSNTCRFVICFLSLSLSATAETIRGAHRELEATVDLGTANNYVILAKTGITNVVDSAVTGHIAVWPIDASAMTGFDFTADSTKKFSTSDQVTGKAYAFSDAPPTPGILGTAVGDMMTAYDDAAGRSISDAARNNLAAGQLAGQTLTPGVYKFTTGVVLSGDITFDGTGVYIIQIAGTLSQAANMKIILSGDAEANQIFWQVAGAVTVGAGAHMEGILLAKTAVTFITGSSLNGRVLTQTACNLQKATITQKPMGEKLADTLAQGALFDPIPYHA